MKNTFQERYETMKSEMRGFLASPKNRIILISGENGTGKTFQVERLSRETGYERFDFRTPEGARGRERCLIWIGPGKYGPAYLYPLFYEYNGCVFHFEDNAFLNPKNKSFLMELASESHRVTYPGATPPPGLPPEFHFHGGIVVTTHQPPETLTDDVRSLFHILDIQVQPDPENMIRLLKLEMDSIVVAFNQKLPELAITVEDGHNALSLYRELFNERSATEQIEVPYMVSIFHSFEMLRTLTSSLYTLEEKKMAVQLSFTDIPGHVSGVYLAEQQTVG